MIEEPIVPRNTGKLGGGQARRVRFRQFLMAGGVDYSSFCSKLKRLIAEFAAFPVNVGGNEDAWPYFEFLDDFEDEVECLCSDAYGR